MIKIDLITGYLGAGKTTFIREYARYLMGQGEKICIIENDYGAVNIDMVLLQDLLGENCNLEMIVGGDGKEAHRRRYKTKLISMGMQGFDRVIIEPSGIYDVDEFFDVLYDEPLDRWYEVGNVISLVDSGAVFDLSGIERYIFMSEIAQAGKLVFTKVTDPASIPAITDAVNRIMEEYKAAPFDPKRDIMIGAFAHPFEKDAPEQPITGLSEADFASLKTCGYRHASYAKLPVGEKQFTPLFYFDAQMPESVLLELVQKMFANRDAGHVIRIKGIVQTGEDSRISINATEKQTTLEPAAGSRNILILIGEGLDKSYFNELLKDYCSVVSL